ncbi:MAG TPA: hypothetical protein VGG16_26985 [Streptosporangiaceae bacterium]|jgi:uncharacterized protein YndB with AHSA1/START domain
MDWILDRVLPRYQFRTRYTRTIAAPPEAVWAAAFAVTAEDLPVTRLLMKVRSAGRSRMTGPLLKTMSMPVLGRSDGQEIVLGEVAKFWQPRPTRRASDPAAFAAFAEPGWAKGALSLQLTPTAIGTQLAAETRVEATDERSRRLFRAYWAFIRLGGAGLIRLELLGAIARRAEGGPGLTPG